MMAEFIKALKGIINEKGLKQKAIANRIGWSERQFSDMMCGRRNISPEDISKICLALNVEPNDLISISSANEARMGEKA